jgi:integrase
MKGGIYSRERCPLCGGKLHDNLKDAVCCQVHPEQRASRFEVRFKAVSGRFRSYEAAIRFLTGLRFKHDEGSFDPREYRKDNPLGFENLSLKWLRIRRASSLKPRSYNAVSNHLHRASKFFGNQNIKEINYGDIEDFFLRQTDITDKTKANIKSSLHDFFSWVKKREDKGMPAFEIPEFPTIKPELGYRNLLSKEDQFAVLDEVKRLIWRKNPKVWIAINWLSTYFSIRPGEMLKIKEGEINLSIGHFIIPHPKEKRYKSVPMLDEDIELAREFITDPGKRLLPFFRHPAGISGVALDEPFGNRLLWKYWKAACHNLKIYDVDLYGGTKHSSITALSAFFSPEEIMESAKISTNKAFKRYLQTDAEKVKILYRKARGAEVIKFEPAKKVPKDFGTS